MRRDSTQALEPGLHQVWSWPASEGDKILMAIALPTLTTIGSFLSPT